MKENTTLTVADIIKHLQTFPQNMEVWTTWDESGEYWPAETPQGRVDFIQELPYRDRIRWEREDEPGAGKPVCVLLSSSLFELEKE